MKITWIGKEIIRRVQNKLYIADVQVQSSPQKIQQTNYTPHAASTNTYLSITHITGIFIMFPKCIWLNAKHESDHHQQDAEYVKLVLPDATPNLSYISVPANYTTESHLSGYAIGSQTSV